MQEGNVPFKYPPSIPCLLYSTNAAVDTINLFHQWIQSNVIEIVTHAALYNVACRKDMTTDWNQFLSMVELVREVLASTFPASGEVFLQIGTSFWAPLLQIILRELNMSVLEKPGFASVTRSLRKYLVATWFVMLSFPWTLDPNSIFGHILLPISCMSSRKMFSSICFLSF